MCFPAPPNFNQSAAASALRAERNARLAYEQMLAHRDRANSKVVRFPSPKPTPPRDSLAPLFIVAFFLVLALAAGGLLAYGVLTQ